MGNITSDLDISAREPHAFYKSDNNRPAGMNLSCGLDETVLPSSSNQHFDVLFGPDKPLDISNHHNRQVGIKILLYTEFFFLTRALLAHIAKGR